MNPEVKTKWLEALRSGKYKQGTGKLRSTDDTFCCLGVLCDIAEQEGVVAAERNEELLEEFPDLHLDWYYDDTDTELPLSVVDWAGLSSRNPMLGADSCIELNDELEKTFPEIADEIEKAL